MPGEDRFKEPRIFDMPSYTMAVVESRGDPNVVGDEVLGPLYGAVYGLKFQRRKEGLEDFKVAGLRARWPDAHLKPKDQWTGLWGLPIPDGTTELPKKVEKPEVRIEVWEYGAIAQILHVGPYSEEGPTIEHLHRFIEESGFEIAGVHEEEYLTRPTAKEQKAFIRYPVRRKK